MNKFSVTFMDKFEVANGEKFAIGEILIGSFSEKFRASMSYWNVDQYMIQWRQALRRLIEGAGTTALITSMYNPESANFIFWWILYRVEEAVYVQNHVLFMDEIDVFFDEKCVYDFIPQRETINEDGDKISEWTTDLEAVKAFWGSF